MEDSRNVVIVVVAVVVAAGVVVAKLFLAKSPWDGSASRPRGARAWVALNRRFLQRPLLVELLHAAGLALDLAVDLALPW